MMVQSACKPSTEPPARGNNSETVMPNVFVLMPFDEDFDAVYKDFIKLVMEEVGFGVVRADEIKGQNNILRDVIKGIAQSDLIVADMTGANANVFYELGIAHALRKSVIHITQNRDDSPFDIEAYRSLEYDTHFSEIGKAKESLSKLAKDFLEETAKFSNPVSDFYPSSEVEEEGGQEVRDYLKGIREYCNGFTEEVSKDVEALDNHGKQFSKHVTELSQSQGNVVRHLCDVFANRIRDFETGFQKHNEDYEKSISNPQGDLGFLISRYKGDFSDTNSVIDSLKTSLLVNQSRLIQLAWRLENIPINLHLHGFEGQRLYLARVCNQAGAEIRALAENLDKTTASISRFLKHDG